MRLISNYFRSLTETFGNGWNRFWFTAVDPMPVCLLRVLVGLAAICFLVSHTADLVVWFSDDGLLPAETVRHLTGASRVGPLGEQPSSFRWSYLYFAETQGHLWTVHCAGMLVVLAFTLGIFTRITNVLSLFIVLAYIHRAPMITGPFEPILTMMLLYLCLAPSGSRLSLDALLRRRTMIHAPGSEGRPDDRDSHSMAANISLRLMQVHLAGFYLMMGLTKLAGETWWAGEAVWWLIARTETRLFDLSFLHSHILAINLWTHVVVLFELTFGVLVWNRLARPMLLSAAVFVWISLALLTGFVSFCLMMLIGNLCFVPPEHARAVIDWFRQLRGSSQPAADTAS